MMTSLHKHAAISHTGKARANNEDYFLAEPSLNLYVLADGIGGHNYGEVAAQKACEVVVEKFRQINALAPISDLDTALSAMKFAIYSANRQVYQMALDDPTYKGMGTTLVVFFQLGEDVIIGHVGDSRCYKYEKELEKLTQDHTIFVSKSPKSLSLRSKHYLTKSIGLKEFIEPTIQHFKTPKSSSYLLCSDGLSDYLAEECIIKVLNNKSTLEQQASSLLEKALETDAKDNITFILISPL